MLLKSNFKKALGINFLFFQLLFLNSCNPLGNIVVKGINSDSIAPTINYYTVTPTTMNGARDFLLDFEVTDNKNVSFAELYYSPDGSNPGQGFVKIGTYQEGRKQIKFCVPNKTHVRPTFKIRAQDSAGNSAEKTLGAFAGEDLTINITEPNFPNLSSSAGSATNLASTEILVDSCNLATSCSADAVYYEQPNLDFYIAIAAVQPGVGSALWVSCQDVLNNGYTLANFASEGPVTYKTWVKSFDPQTTISSVTSTSSDVTVTYDATIPVSQFNIAATAMNSHEDFTVNYDLTDATSGMSTGKIYYTPDKTNLATYPYVELGNLTFGTNKTIKFCAPNKNHPAGSFRINGADAAGNSSSISLDGFTVNRTADNLLPNVASISAAAAPVNSGNVKVYIDACKQTTCATGSLAYSAPDNNVYVAIATAQPAAGSASWVSCSTVLSNGYTVAVPNNVGSGTYTTGIWVKSSNNDLDGSTPVNTISTASVPVTIDYDYTGPSLTGLNIGNLGTNLNLSIIGTNILTGYSRGSFKLSPSCIDPASIPVTQTYIAGTVTVATNNIDVTGSGTSFTTEFSVGDYTEINGVYTQIKTIISDTQMTLNEISGNNSLLVGTFQASKKMKSYGGIKVTKGAGGPPGATGADWQACDSINQTIVYDNLSSGVNNLQFWLKDSGDNVATTPIMYAVTYNPPVITVVDGPTISENTAHMTINACGGGTKISKVLFNETSVKPLASDPLWQTCSTTAGALTSSTLTPGNHTLKAYFLYTDNVVSENPVNVPVNYLPAVDWYEDTAVNRPQVSFTLVSCNGIDEVYINQSTAPGAGAAGWQTCSTVAGAIKYDLTSTGSQTVNVWYKSAGVVSPDYSQVTVNFDPPSASTSLGATVNTTNPFLTVDDCTNVSKVFIKLDDGTATAPTSADFAGAGGIACTTALDGIPTPTLSGEGAHTYDVWFQYTDGYILNPWYSRVEVTYIQSDTTPPPINPGAGVDVPLLLTLTNGDGAGLVPGAQENITASNSRAIFTLNTCNPKTPVNIMGTVSVTAGTNTVTGAGTTFTTQLAVGDYLKIGTESIKIASITSNTSLTLIYNHSVGAAGSVATKVFPNDVVTGMIITESSTAPSADDAYWVDCDTTANGFKSRSLTNGVHTLYAWFKDSSGNIAGGAANFVKDVLIDTSADAIVPTRPLVTVVGAPTITTSPAKLTISSCADVDQVYVETSPNPSPYVAPSASSASWQDCSTTAGAIEYPVTLRGSYTLAVWFKDTAGNINATPREVSFIFDPAIGTLPNPVAYWTMDASHIRKNRVVDIKGTSHLYIWDPVQVTQVSGWDKQALNLSGTDSYLFTENTSTLKPASALTISMWAYLTKNEAGTKGLVDNGSYGFKLQGGNLYFYASGTANTVSVATSSYETGWHHLIGTTNGRYLYFFLDGTSVGAPLDLGSASNLSYGSSQLLVIGGLTNGASPNPNTSGKFDNKIDEVVIWDKYFTSAQARTHYIDTYNNYKVNQVATLPSDIASATFEKEFLQNVLLTIPSCGNAKFVYIDETTHPPTASDSKWQLCSTVKSAIIHENLSQGSHELKIWAKDEYENISSGYFKVDTTITGTTYQDKGILYYTLDNNQTNISTIYDIFSDHSATVVGADANQSAIRGEGYRFVRASSDYIERKYAFNAQPKDKVTVSSWVNLTTADSRSQVILGTRTASSGYSLEIDGPSSQLRFYIETSGGTRYASVASSAYTTGFHNIVGVYDGQHVKLYIDGVLQDDQDYGSVLNINYSCLGSFIIGAKSSCNTGPVAGTNLDSTVDEVIVWNDALATTKVEDIYNGQDTIPPDPVGVTPKGNNYTVEVPVAKFNIADCTDVASVYISSTSTKPTSDVANWQTCATSGDIIKSPMLDSGSNNLKVWFKDLAGNVSTTSTDLAITFNYNSLIPNPSSYWTLDKVNIDGAIAKDVVSAKDGVITGATEVAGKVDEALTFTGDDFIEVANDSNQSPSNEVSLSTWFKSSNYATGGEQYLMGNLNNGGYALLLDNNVIEFKIVVDGVTYTMSAPTNTLNTANWHNVVGSYKADGTIRLFLDGAEVLPSITVPSVSKTITYNNTNSFVLGAAAPATTGNNGSFFVGQLDEMGLWDEALTDTVVSEIYDRGVQGDKIYYDLTPPTIPISTNITYYNSLVSRANLSVNSCTGLDYIIVTKDEFPPDKNDPDWQICNTLVGGLLSKELSPSDSFGKLWTRDSFGNISKNFEYVAVSTQYDKPISRPVAHWTFDNDHYVIGTRTVVDRLNQINLKAETLKNTSVPAFCGIVQSLDTTATTLLTNQSGVLNQSFSFSGSTVAHDQFGNWLKPAILRTNHPANLKIKPTSNLTVAAWVYIVGNTTYPYDKHIVSNMVGAKGWALRILAPSTTTGGVRFTVYTDQGLLEPYLETVNIATGWHLVAGTFDGQTASLFMDGIFVKSFSLPTSGNIIYENGTNTFIGSQASITTFPTRGYTASDASPVCGSGAGGIIADNSYYTDKIDEVIVWDKAISKLEMSSLYHNGADVLYSTDVAEPTLPTIAQENTRSTMYTDKAHFTLSSCYTAGPLADVISGVLVNEGTQPDKQDERWEACRTRPGSFGLENLSVGGHTITFWFKDLAGNVSSVSQDKVVTYVQKTLPQGNAYWPLDSIQSISKYTRDTIGNKENDLQLVNVDTPFNPTAVHTASILNEGIKLAASSTTNGAFLYADSSQYLKPVNYMSIGGWFYLTQNDNNLKTLIDHHRYNSSISRGGYALYVGTSNLNFLLELDIAGQKNISTPMSGITTGWHYVVGTFTGYKSLLYVDGVQVATSGTLAERDFIRWDSSAPRDFKVGADFNDNANPQTFFGEKVDELGLWGFDLSSTQVAAIKNANQAGTHIHEALTTPSNVNNAFISYYGGFGSRVRMTILDCTNTPYIFVTARNAAVPSASDPDWRSCTNLPGGIISKKLPLNTSYVDVYAKNLDGVISTVAGWKEIDPIAYDYDLVMPISYMSFNLDQVNGGESDSIINNKGVLNSSTTHVSNTDGSAVRFTVTADSLTIPVQKIYDLREGLTFGIWVDLINNDNGNRVILGRTNPASNLDTSLIVESGYLKFQLNIPTVTTYYRSTNWPQAVYPMANITTGKHFVVGSYDGYDLKMYLDSVLVAQTSIGERNYTSSTKRIIDMDALGGFLLNYGSGIAGIVGEMDEFMLFDKVLTEAEIVAWYRRYKIATSVADTTPPALGRTLGVANSSFAGSWSTERDYPIYTINDCTDIAGVYVTFSSTPPLPGDTGWQECKIPGGVTGPTLSVGANTIYVYYKDANGNVSGSQQIPVTYTVAPRPDPVAYWSFNDDNLVGRYLHEPINNLHANLFGIKATDFQSGAEGTAIKFDGIRKYAEIPHNSIIKPIDKWSVSFWLKDPPAAHSSGRTILGNRADYTQEGFSFRWSCHSPANYVYSSEAGVNSCSGDPYEYFELWLNVDGTDYLLDYPSGSLTMPGHVAATFDGRFIRLYWNATLLKEKDTGKKGAIYYDATNNSSLVVGARASASRKPSQKFVYDPTRYYNGSIDELAIYNYALHPSHVTDIYNNFIVSPNKLYDPNFTVITPPNARARIFEKDKKSFGSRLKITMSSCVDTQMILVNDSTTAPAANSEDWQACNTYVGGILSAPMTNNSVVTPKVWAKSFDGQVSASYGTVNGETYTIPDITDDVPRPEVVWTLDSVNSGHTTATAIKDIISWSDGVFDLVGTPDSNVVQLSGLITIAAGTASVSGSGSSFTTELQVGDRVRIGDQILQVKTITNNTALTAENNHILGATNATSFRIGSMATGKKSVLEGGYDFNGLSDYITASPTGATNAFYETTISVWAELKRGDQLYRHIVGNSQDGTNASGGGIGIQVKDGQLQFFVNVWSPTSTTATTYTAYIDNDLYSTGLHHITGTYNGREIKLYLDGVLLHTTWILFYDLTTKYQIHHDDFSYWTIGAETGTSNIAVANSFQYGVIDDINIWHESLTDEEVFYVYEYGSDNLVKPVPDGIAPTDPGIKIADGLTNRSSAWANFTIPSCTGANGIEIDGIWIGKSTDPVPKSSDEGWQNCSIDTSYFVSGILTSGTNNLVIYFRDNQGDVSPSVPVTVKYVAPLMPNPLAYYSFDDNDRTGFSIFNDLAGTKHIREYTTFPSGALISGKVDKALWSTGYNGSLIYRTYRSDYDLGTDFTYSDWLYIDGSLSTWNITLVDQGQFRIIRTPSEKIIVEVLAGGTTYSLTSSSQLTPLSWTHVSVVRSGASLKIYFNGVQDSAKVVSASPLDANTTRMSIRGGEMGYGFLTGHDEFILYDQGLSKDQIEYIYYKGSTGSNVDVNVPTGVSGKKPTVYWNFDTSSISGDYLNSVVNNIPLRIVHGVTTGQNGANSINGESFYFTRYEDKTTALETNGPHQYLETDTVAPITLGQNFTFSTWVKQPQAYGFYCSSSCGTETTDFTAIVDMWGKDIADQAFSLTYERGANAFTNVTYSFSLRDTLGGLYTVSSDAAAYPLTTNNVWTHVAVRRSGRILSLYLSGVEVNSIVLPVNAIINVPGQTRLRVGESSQYGYYNIPGTVTVGAGSTSVTGTGTTFLTDLYPVKKGTVTVASGSTSVAGVGTSFNTQFVVGDVVRIAGEYKTIASIVSAVSMTLTTTHTAGASGVPIYRQAKNIRIENQNLTVASIASDTSLTLATSHTTGATNATLGNNISILPVSDEYNLKGFVDELAYWDSSLTQRQIYYLYEKGLANQSIPIVPTATLNAGEGITNVNINKAQVIINDCLGYTDIWVGLTTDPDPLSTDPGWATCNSNTAFDLPTLVGGANNFKIWFKTGGVVDTYTTTVSVTYNTADTTAPTPPTVTHVTGTPTTDPFALFTLNTCNDIYGVFIGPTGSTPNPNTSGWQNCSTLSSAFSYTLASGVNNVSFWFKDTVGNISASTDFTITYNPAAMTNPLFYFTMDDAQISASKFQRDIVAYNVASSSSTTNLTSGYNGKVNQAVRMTSNAYYDLLLTTPSLTDKLSLAAWVKVSPPTSDSQIIGQWDGSSANDSYAIRINSFGRLCLDYQTTASTGTWNTSTYGRVCSSTAVTFSTWAHIALVRNGATVSFFINGSAAGTATIDANNFVASSLTPHIGSQARGISNSGYDGLIDELGFWNIALTSDQRKLVHAKNLSGLNAFTESAAVTPGVNPDYYWQFETASPLADDMANINFTTLSASNPFIVSCQVGDCYDFSAASAQYVKTTAPTTVDLSGNFTIAFWMNADNFSSDKDMINKWGNGSTEAQFKVSLSPAGLVRFEYNLSSGLGSLVASQAISAGSWVHVAVTRSGSGLYLYLNGGLQAVANIGANAMTNYGTPIVLGGNQPNNSNYFDGLLDDFVIYKSHLYERKIRYILNKGLAGNPIIP